MQQFGPEIEQSWTYDTPDFFFHTPWDHHARSAPPLHVRIDVPVIIITEEKHRGQLRVLLMHLRRFICKHPFLNCFSFVFSAVISLRSFKCVILLALLETSTSVAASGNPFGVAGFPVCVFHSPASSLCTQRNPGGNASHLKSSSGKADVSIKTEVQWKQT